MTVTVEIHPSSSSLAMYGWPERSTAYSLSGHVSVKLSPKFYFFDSSPVRILLRSLKLTFEGSSELITQQLGYTAARIVRTKHQLAPAQSMILSTDNVDPDDTDKETTWNFNFNIPIPGWLPSTTTFGNSQYGPAGTRYALFAEARYLVLGQNSSFERIMGTKVRVVQAEHADIRIQRYMLPPLINADPTEPMGLPAFPEQKLPIKLAIRMKNADSTKLIDPGIMQRIEVEAYMPEFVNIDDSVFKLRLKLRASKLTSEERRLLKIREFVIDDLVQNETYVNSPALSNYGNYFPLSKRQPDTKPLLNPHPLKSMYDVGLVSFPPDVTDPLCFKKSFSFSHTSDKYHLAVEKDVSFANINKNDWINADMEVQFVAFGGHKFDDDLAERHGGLVTGVRTSESSPLFTVSHHAVIILKCSYGEDEDKNRATSELRFRVPLFFVHVPPLTLANNLLHCAAPARAPWVRNSAPALPVDESEAEAFRLPPYSQLFLPNGDPRQDYQLSLPAYTPRDPSHPTVDPEEGRVPCSIPFSV